VFEKFKRKKNY